MKTKYALLLLLAIFVWHHAPAKNPNDKAKVIKTLIVDEIGRAHV